MIFKQRINETLKNCQYSQKQIAKILNISEGNITNWKNGDNMPSIEILYRLCILLNVSSDYLLGLENDDGTKTYNNNTYNNFGTHQGDVKF